MEELLCMKLVTQLETPLTVALSISNGCTTTMVLHIAVDDLHFRAPKLTADRFTTLRLRCLGECGGVRHWHRFQGMRLISF